jgi:hypothetical protein
MNSSHKGKELRERSFRLARKWSNQELRKISHLFAGDIVNVSAGENIDKEGRTYDEYFTNKTGYFTTNYHPGAFRGYQGRPNEYLLDLEGDIPDELSGRFDVVFNHTVLEHVFDVRAAFSNLCRLSRDVVIIVVPFVQEQHDTTGYNDFWRFAPNGLRHLFRDNGLSVIYESCNYDQDAAVYLFFVGSRQPEKWQEHMPTYQPITDAGSWIGSSKLLENATARESFKQLRRALRAKVNSWLRKADAE